MDLRESAMDNKVFYCLVACTLLAIVPACGKGGLDTVPVSGRVTYQGKPLASGTITFSPENKDSGHAAWGDLDPEGRYLLTTIKINDGALPGQYRVAVVSFVPGTATAVSRGVRAIPERYSRHADSGLMATVGDAGAALDFDLK
jgi:hypothetical protein